MVVWHGVVWHRIEWYRMVWHGMMRYGMVGLVWYRMVWYGVVWCGMVWYPANEILDPRGFTDELGRPKADRASQTYAYPFCEQGIQLWHAISSFGYPVNKACN